MNLGASSLFLLASNVAGAGFGFLFWTIAARVYPAQEVGVAAATISSMGLLAALSTLGLDHGLVRFLPASSAPRAVINTALSISATAACLLGFAFLAGLDVWSPALKAVHHVAPVVSAIPAGSIGMALLPLLSGICLVRGRADLALLLAVLFGASKTALALLFSGFPLAWTLSWAWSIGVLLSAVCGLFILLPKVEGSSYRFHPAANVQTVREISRFTSTNYLVAVLWNAPNFVLPLLILNLMSSEASAHFYVASSISGLVSMIPIAVSLALFAHGSVDDTQLTRLSVEGIKFAVLLQLPAVIAVFSFGSALLGFFGDDYAREGTAVLRLLALATLPMTANFLFFGVKRVRRQMAEVVGYSAWSLAVTLIVTLLLLPRVGLPGVGIASLMSQSSTTALIAALRLGRGPARKLSPTSSSS